MNSRPGCQDILIAVVDGLKGLAEAIGTAFPRTTVQTCIVHLIRNSLDYAGWKDRKAVAVALRPIYAAASAQAAEQALLTLADGPWGSVPNDCRGLAAAWEHVTPFFVFPGHQARDLHDQRHRELEHAIAQDHQDARPLQR